jgi:ribosomal protein S18 acetylase RimI-like enzyme
MIRLLTPQDFSQISIIWQSCFGDSEQYIRFFWTHGFSLCRGLACEQNGQLVSMLFLLPGALALSEEQLPAGYVYAVATLPAFRGRGFAAALARRAAELAREKGWAALCLLPGEESLFN